MGLKIFFSGFIRSFYKGEKHALLISYVDKLKEDNTYFKSQISKRTNKVIDELCKHYKLIPKEYVKKYINHIKADHFENPLATLYIEAVLGAPLRQIELIKKLENHGFIFKNKTVLDIGCANGSLLLACYNAGAKKLVGIDIAAHHIEDAKMIIGKKNIDLLTIDITTQDLPEEYKPFNIILSTDVLEHVADVKQFFLKIKNIYLLTIVTVLHIFQYIIKTISTVFYPNLIITFRE